MTGSTLSRHPSRGRGYTCAGSLQPVDRSTNRSVDHFVRRSLWTSNRATACRCCCCYSNRTHPTCHPHLPTHPPSYQPRSNDAALSPSPTQCDAERFKTIWRTAPVRPVQSSRVQPPRPSALFGTKNRPAATCAPATQDPKSTQRHHPPRTTLDFPPSHFLRFSLPSSVGHQISTGRPGQQASERAGGPREGGKEGRQQASSRSPLPSPPTHGLPTRTARRFGVRLLGLLSRLAAGSVGLKVGLTAREEVPSRD